MTMQGASSPSTSTPPAGTPRAPEPRPLNLNFETLSPADRDNLEQELVAANKSGTFLCFLAYITPPADPNKKTNDLEYRLIMAGKPEFPVADYNVCLEHLQKMLEEKAAEAAQLAQANGVAK